MKIDRLFQIVYLLMERGSLTAGELSQRFEVSTRTIFRDVETLAQAGVPVYTTRGKGGGIHLMDGYTMDRSLLSQEEQRELLSALAGFRAAQYPDADAVLKKLGAFFGREDGADWIQVDFTQWSGHQAVIFSLIKQAILEKQVITFDYYSSYQHHTHRSVEPLQLQFYGRAWYLFAFCRHRNALRQFKLNRMRNPILTGEHFSRTLADAATLPPTPPSQRLTITEVVFTVHKSQAHRVYDEFPSHWVTVLENGDFLVKSLYPMEDWVLGNILSYGPHAKVLSPGWFRDALIQSLEESFNNYLKQDTEMSSLLPYPETNKPGEAYYPPKEEQSMENVQFCQSCAMPLSDGLYGTEADGTLSQDYCKYCYENGAFTADTTMEEMIEFCVRPMVENNEGMTEEVARQQMQAFFPQLKRWQK
ncbi:WYL domain-containing protein [Eubacteriales bacterium OttesenSCG-928-M02]|nr:WYL domain-containing protein [Eubacteriales bacterium OttesenSCG-928-M02]